MDERADVLGPDSADCDDRKAHRRNDIVDEAALAARDAGMRWCLEHVPGDAPIRPSLLGIAGLVRRMDARADPERWSDRLDVRHGDGLVRELNSLNPAGERYVHPIVDYAPALGLLVQLE